MEAVTSGEPQGSVLGPTIFLLFIIDIDSRVRLFTDDIIIYREINSANDSQQLQQDLDS